MVRCTMGAFVVVVVALAFAGCNVSDPQVAEPDPCVGISCGQNGECSSGDEGPVCECDAGYMGDDCSECASGFVQDGASCVEGCTAETCGENGTCGADGMCACNEGYSGEGCGACASGYVEAEGACAPVVTCEEADPCGEQGTCSNTQTGIECACEDGYDGDRCDRCADTHYLSPDGECLMRETCESDTCNDRGECDDSSGAVECDCSPAYGGDRCQECYPGYVEDGGECVVAQSCQPGTCFGNGLCDDSSGLVACTCNFGYRQPFCDDCALGHTGADCSECLPGYSLIGDSCQPICADGLFVEGEVCEDGNTDPSNGQTDFCSTDCTFTNWPGPWPGFIPTTYSNAWWSWSSITINGNSSRYKVVSPGEELAIGGAWTFDKSVSGCPTCVTQFYLGFWSEDPANTANGSPVWCERSAQTNTAPVTISATTTAPSEPGVYYLRPGRTWHFDCQPSFGNVGPAGNLFVIYVQDE